MPDRDQEGLSLSAAIRRFADPDKWRRYDQAATAARGRVRTRLMYVGGEPIAGWGAAEQARHDNHLLDRRDQAWREWRAKTCYSVETAVLRSAHIADGTRNSIENKRKIWFGGTRAPRRINETTTENHVQTIT